MIEFGFYQLIIKLIFEFILKKYDSQSKYRTSLKTLFSQIDCVIYLKSIQRRLNEKGNGLCVLKQRRVVNEKGKSLTLIQCHFKVTSVTSI